MKEMNTDPFKILGEVKQVESPDFMLTRIYARIEAGRAAYFKPVVGWTLGAFMAAILVLNIAVVAKNNQANKSETEAFSFLTPSNNLYNE